MTKLTRRQALKYAAATGTVAIFGGTLGAARPAQAATELTVVEWGGDVVEAMKQIEAKQDKVKVNWVLHQGGSGAILPKIKATWPQAEYDYVAGWEGSFNGMVKEDWLVPVTVETVPNLADIPAEDHRQECEGRMDGGAARRRRHLCRLSQGHLPGRGEEHRRSVRPAPQGQDLLAGPDAGMMLPLVALALHDGGNENNMDPGFALMKKLAQSGNIGRVGVTDTDFSTSLTSGETALGFYSEPQLTAVAKSFPLVRLTKQKGVPTFLYQSGFAVFKNRPNLQATLDFVNFCISPEMSSLYAEVAGEAPLNTKAKTPDSLKHLAFTPQEMDEFVYVPDFNVVLSQQDAWSKRWENEIAPLL